MYAQIAHTRRSASLLVSILLVSLLSLGACTSSTGPKDPDSGSADARASLRPALQIRQAVKKQARMNPRGDQAVAAVSLSELHVVKILDGASAK